jgi:predicted ATPase
VTSKKERILEALGTNGQLLVNVIPSLQLLIGVQSAPHVDLGVTEMKTLFNQLFARLVDVFCSFTPGRPLVIFLDDLHWADHPSFQLLEKLVRSPSPFVFFLFFFFSFFLFFFSFIFFEGRSLCAHPLICADLPIFAHGWVAPPGRRLSR